jgi:peptidoglycan biosynthesis protein MviN/MurJ (putative lipid II flippase)
MLGSLWQPTYPLVAPSTIGIMGGCVQAGAGTGLHALGSARRSLRAMVVVSVLFVGCGLLGTAADGAFGTMCGAAVASWIGALVFWLQLRRALRESDNVPALNRQPGRHRKPYSPNVI